MPKPSNTASNKKTAAAPVVPVVAEIPIESFEADVDEEMAVLNEIYPGDVSMTAHADGWGKPFRTLVTTVSAGSEDDFTRIEARVSDVSVHTTHAHMHIFACLLDDVWLCLVPRHHEVCPTYTIAQSLPLLVQQHTYSHTSRTFLHAHAHHPLHV